ncbi:MULTISPECIES: ribonuclease E activity regulator RraA [Lysobacter]|uniref:4-hydroxy-4-methyl-2-oxoglutarate aldolase n=1 Tax=Lysobacter yananisis TaxID=1003114 RepID=A0ABY9PG71_9GAMM|nr:MULTISPECIES: ribonuclease E activity regulator RraA [Lysobacter]QQQ02317.1 ribonuclease E activity regulator RraA [Lysobacter enzymogenes]UZW61594.1 ribonuclease E activity regulator RraA [Lysobacter enzymogenes]WMT05458.1 ribonuclease E activity regulator RraA [Lysobacter yananisis]
MNTCDLCDRHDARVRVLDLPLRDFGGRIGFAGIVSTIKAYEDNSRVREAVAEPGAGRVLVIDGGGSSRRAMLGDQLAAQAVANGWAGVVVFGAIRDSAAIGAMALGVKALGTCPRKTDKHGQGLRDVALAFGGVSIRPGDWVCADEDGVVFADEALE